MATFLTFRGYGVGSSDVDIDVERVTHFYSISYNGSYGVELALDNGSTIRVEGFSQDVRKRITDALGRKAR